MLYNTIDWFSTSKLKLKEHLLFLPRKQIYEVNCKQSPNPRIKIPNKFSCLHKLCICWFGILNVVREYFEKNMFVALVIGKVKNDESNTWICLKMQYMLNQRDFCSHIYITKVSIKATKTKLSEVWMGNVLESYYV